MADRARVGLEVAWLAIGVGVLPGFILYGLLGFEGDLEQLGSARLAGLIAFQNLLAIGAIALFLRLERRGFSYLGFRRGDPGLEAALGFLLFFPILILAGAFQVALVWAFPSLRTTDENPLLGMIQGPGDLAIFLAISIVVGGLCEETIRAFVLRRFGSHLGGMGAGLVVWSVIFGAWHLTQGWDKAITVAFLGLLLGLVYAWRRSPVAPVVAHATFDVSMVLIWFLYRPGYPSDCGS
jgi:membrane protease YdiL (CAAX protease family)